MGCNEGDEVKAEGIEEEKFFLEFGGIRILREGLLGLMRLSFGWDWKGGNYGGFGGGGGERGEIEVSWTGKWRDNGGVFGLKIGFREGGIAGGGKVECFYHFSF